MPEGRGPWPDEDKFEKFVLILGEDDLNRLDDDYHDLAGVIQKPENLKALDEFAQMLVDSGELNFAEEPNLDYIKGVAHGWIAARLGTGDIDDLP